MFKVVIDATPITQRPSGVGFHVANLICALEKLQVQENFQLSIAFQPRLKKWLQGDWGFPDYLQKHSNLHFFPIPVKISNFLSFNNIVPFISYYEKYFGYPNIIHGTNYFVYPCQKSYKVMNLYDLAFLKYPQYTQSSVQNYIKTTVTRCLEWTDLILTFSENSKQEIIQYLQVDSNKICVTPLASRYQTNFFYPEYLEKLNNQIQYDFSRPYLLFVSTIEPRKNIIAIISAFNYLKHKYGIDHQLVLIGRKGWKYQPIFTAIKNSPFAKQIHHLDYLSDELVALFYAKADVFVYPSHYEGFGLPVLEAMTLGAPIVTSNTSSLPEVAGDAALLINPNEPMQLAEAILKVISSSHLRQQLIDKGKERVKLFSWERTAKETLKAYRSIS